MKVSVLPKYILKSNNILLILNQLYETCISSVNNDIVYNIKDKILPNL
ncbi:MAG: hypothetical protein IJU54_01065 [Alphaproteobacteria bacterium]|nr:hypothetical protein [Alphaproteobacteria bacterium]